MLKWRKLKPSFLPARKSKRVLFFSHETTWSGAPIQLLHLIQWLKQRGWDVTAVVPKLTSPQSGPISAQLEAIGVKIIPLLDFTVAPDLGELSSLCREFDLVVANTLVMSAAVRAAVDSGIPVIWYIHETLLFWRLLELNPEIRSTLALPNRIVVPTELAARLYAPFTDRPIRVLPYGIPPVTNRRVTKRDSAPIRFLLLGSYEPRKGQDVFLDAIAQLQLPGALQRAAHFQMAGRKLDAPFFEALAARSIQPNVLLSDALEHDEALAAAAAADVLVCASRDETMPIAILEAMSLGKAIITTDVGGILEWLRDGVNALVVPVENAPALAEALRRCLAEPGLIDSLGKKARRTFSAEFSLDRLGRQFSRLMRQVMREKQS